MTERDDAYPEIKHCRSCGKLILTTMDPPLCDECWIDKVEGWEEIVGETGGDLDESDEG